MTTMFNSFTRLACLAFLLNYTLAYIEPITIKGRYFMKSISDEPFFIKGVDYQPGGSSAVSDSSDPLSDPQICARDIVLFQDLGINTIRVYSVNPELNHDSCMSLLAAADIYLILDVNSPQQNQHLNRYEPHTSYSELYLAHIFLVIEQFSGYNNTLGFFAGNEVINDKISAKASPVYVKAIVGDMKKYISFNSPRYIPVGYSAADDLMFRMSLSEFLECENVGLMDSVDFYGVNSYQWCGEQTFYSSGYNVLVDDYSTYSKPVFFSETFGEVSSIYSNDMTNVFSGGLVYEFSQEPNNYGLVEINQDGSIIIQQDYIELKARYKYLPNLDISQIKANIKNYEREERARTDNNQRLKCAQAYANLDITRKIPNNLADNLIEMGVSIEQGKLIQLDESQYESVFPYYLFDGTTYDVPTKVAAVQKIVKEPKLNLIFRFQNCTYNF